MFGGGDRYPNEALKECDWSFWPVAVTGGPVSYVTTALMLRGLAGKNLERRWVRYSALTCLGTIGSRILAGEVLGFVFVKLALSGQAPGL